MKGGSYEEGIEPDVYCLNDRVPVVEDGENYLTDCGFTDDAKDEYTPISHWYDFDVVLYSAVNGESTEDYIGEPWEDFVRNDTDSLLKETI
ncbi:hypothetical protein [Brevibacillus laterosporus]|nr:hypothetical protein [Brevibacillus laterosporus]